MSFTTKDLIKGFDGLKANTLHFWCELGYVKPLQNSGRGGKRLFDEENALRVGIMFHLMKFGLGRKASNAFIENARQEDGILKSKKNSIVEVYVDLKEIKQQLTSGSIGR